MGQIEVNALSVKLAGSFEAEVVFPGIHMDAKRKYPVLWMIHEDGSSPADLLRYIKLFEAYAKKNNCYVIAPSVAHSLCTDMVWGTLNEQFAGTECPGIFRHMYHLSDRSQDNTILGMGTGAYGAVKLAQHHPETFGKAVAIEGNLDLAARCDHTPKDARNGFAFQTDASLKAIFGDPKTLRGSMNDLYALDYSETKVILYADVNSSVFEENQRLADKNPMIQTYFVSMEQECFAREKMLKEFLDV